MFYQNVFLVKCIYGIKFIICLAEIGFSLMIICIVHRMRESTQRLHNIIFCVCTDKIAKTIYFGIRRAKSLTMKKIVQLSNGTKKQNEAAQVLATSSIKHIHSCPWHFLFIRLEHSHTACKREPRWFHFKIPIEYSHTTSFDDNLFSSSVVFGCTHSSLVVDLRFT